MPRLPPTTRSTVRCVEGPVSPSATAAARHLSGIRRRRCSTGHSAGGGRRHDRPVFSRNADCDGRAPFERAVRRRAEWSHPAGFRGRRRRQLSAGWRPATCRRSRGWPFLYSQIVQSTVRARRDRRAAADGPRADPAPSACHAPLETAGRGGRMARLRRVSHEPYRGGHGQLCAGGCLAFKLIAVGGAASRAPEVRDRWARRWDRWPVGLLGRTVASSREARASHPAYGPITFAHSSYATVDKFVLHPAPSRMMSPRRRASRVGLLAHPLPRLKRGAVSAPREAGPEFVDVATGAGRRGE